MIDVENLKLHSGTVIKEIPINLLGYTYKVHWDSENYRIVVLKDWYTNDDNGDVMPEFDIVAVFTKVRELQESIFAFQYD